MMQSHPSSSMTKQDDDRSNRNQTQCLGKSRPSTDDRPASLSNSDRRLSSSSSSSTGVATKKKFNRDWPSSSFRALPDLSRALVQKLEQDSVRFPINEECTSLKFSPSGRLLIACFTDGTVRLFDLTGNFLEVSHSTEFKFDMDDSDSSDSEDEKDAKESSKSSFQDSTPHRAARNKMVLSKENQQFGAVACQIHAKGVHTSLLMDVDCAQDGQYCFAGVLRGSMEMVAIHLKDFEQYCNAVEENKIEDEKHILDLITVHRHSDAKLRGFGACTRLRNGKSSPPKYLLFTGKAIKNIHIWSFEPPFGDKTEATWTQLYNTQTNGNTISMLQFRYDPNGMLQGISKSDDQKLRIWDLTFEQHEGNKNNPFFHKKSIVDQFGQNTSLSCRPKRPPFCDVSNSEATMAVCGGFSICGGGSMYNQISLVSLDVPNPVSPFNHTELALPGIQAGVVRAGRRQQRGDLKSITSVAGMVMDAGNILLEVSDGSIIQFTQRNESTSSLPKLEIIPASKGFQPLTETLQRKICVGRIGSSGVPVAALSSYNCSTGKGSVVLTPLDDVRPMKPREGFWGFSTKLEKMKRAASSQQRREPNSLCPCKPAIEPTKETEEIPSPQADAAAIANCVGAPMDFSPGKSRVKLFGTSESKAARLSFEAKDRQPRKTMHQEKQAALTLSKPKEQRLVNDSRNVKVAKLCNQHGKEVPLSTLRNQNKEKLKVCNVTPVSVSRSGKKKNHASSVDKVESDQSIVQPGRLTFESSSVPTGSSSRSDKKKNHASSVRKRDFHQSTAQPGKSTLEDLVATASKVMKIPSPVTPSILNAASHILVKGSDCTGAISTGSSGIPTSQQPKGKAMLQPIPPSRFSLEHKPRNVVPISTPMQVKRNPLSLISSNESKMQPSPNLPSNAVAITPRSGRAQGNLNAQGIPGFGDKENIGSSSQDARRIAASHTCETPLRSRTNHLPLNSSDARAISSNMMSQVDQSTPIQVPRISPESKTAPQAKAVLPPSKNGIQKYFPTASTSTIAETKAKAANDIHVTRAETATQSVATKAFKSAEKRVEPTSTLEIKPVSRSKSESSSNTVAIKSPPVPRKRGSVGKQEVKSKNEGINSVGHLQSVEKKSSSRPEKTREKSTTKVSPVLEKTETLHDNSSKDSEPNRETGRKQVVTPRRSHKRGQHSSGRKRDASEAQLFNRACLEQQKRIRLLLNAIPPKSFDFARNDDESECETAHKKLIRDHRANHDMILRKVVNAVVSTIQALRQSTSHTAADEARRFMEKVIESYREMMHETLQVQKMEASALEAQYSVTTGEVVTIGVSFPYPHVFNEALKCLNEISKHYV